MPKDATTNPRCRAVRGGLQQILGITYGVEELFSSEAYFIPETEELILSEDTYIGLLEDNGRDRFTVAHEIGHVVLHRPYYRTIRRDRRQAILLCRSQIKPFQHPERQSDVFASEFLIPTQHAQKMLFEGATEKDFMHIFHVSFEAAHVKMERVLKKLKKRPS